MAFSAVTWAFKDQITSAKLAQMQENIRAHDHRGDGTQGAPILRFNLVGTSNASGLVTFNFGITYPSPPIVIGIGGNGEDVSVATGATTTSVTFLCKTGAGAVLVGSVRVLFIVVPA